MGLCASHMCRGLPGTEHPEAAFSVQTRMAGHCVHQVTALPDYVSGTELGMLQPFISNLQNRLCKEGSIIPILQMRGLRGGEITGQADQAY